MNSQAQIPAPLPLDPSIAALADSASTWLLSALMVGLGCGLTLPQTIDQLRPRVFTGYLPEAQRKAVKHGLYSMGVSKPPKRPTAVDRARTEAQKWGLAS